MVRLYALADKYDVKQLEQTVGTQFRSIITSKWGEKNSVQACEEGYYAAHFDGSQQGLFTSIEEVCKEHLEDLIKKEEFVVLLQSVPELSTALLSHSVAECIRWRGLATARVSW